MTTEHAYAVEQRTQQFPPVSVAGDPDPLAKITLPPRGFGATLAAVALILGLVMAIIPVHVAGANPVQPASVVCGNTIGGVESGSIASGLRDYDRQTMATYVNTCESALAERRFYSWPLFFAGGIGILWLLAVRRRRPLTA